MRKQTVKEEYPIVEKSIALTNGERARLLRTMTISSRIKTTLIDMLIEAHTKIQDRENEMWDELAMRFGAKNMDELLDSDKNIEISWANSQINLRSKGVEA